MHLRKPLFETTFWLTALLITLALSAWAIFTHSRHEQISVKAQPDPIEHLTWKVGVPELSTGLSTIRFAGRNLHFDGWKGAQFTVYVFAASRIGAAGKIFEELGLSSDDDVRLNISYDINISGNRTWRSLQYSQSLFSLASFVTNPASNPTSYGIAIASGKDGSKFELQRGQQSCGTGCAGQFADFKGDILTSDPPQFRGLGAEGVNEITVASASAKERRSFPNTQGVLIGAAKTTDLFIREYTDRVLLTAKEGQLYFNGQTLPLGPEILLEISFDPSTPGQIEISHTDPPLVSINGTAEQVRLGGDNLMPRVIDRTPWYLQVIIGMVLTFCVERLYAVFARTKSRAEASNSGDP